MTEECKKCDCNKQKEKIDNECPKEDSCPDVPPDYESRKLSMRSDADVAAYYSQVGKMDDDRRKCFERRRCLLHKYKDTTKDGDACCKGLTGHHLIAEGTFDGKGHCYNHHQALVLCAAGTSNDVGRHGLMHSMTCANYQLSGKSSMKVSDMIDNSVDAMKDVFYESDCDWECIKNDLQESYENMHTSTSQQKKKYENGDCTKLTANTVLPWHCGYGGNEISAGKMSEQFDKCMNQLNSMFS